jgi:hypothetical protein
MSSSDSGPRCGAPKRAGSGSHDLLAGELEDWNCSALTRGLQTMHGQEVRSGVGWHVAGLEWLVIVL